MKKNKIIPLTLIILMITSSCAFHIGTMSGNADLHGNSFELIDIAVGRASTLRVFGIGGLKKDAIVLEAKQNLYKNNPLKTGQAFANVTVDFKISHYLIVTKSDITISADIVQFNSQNGNNDSVQTVFKNIEKIGLRLKDPLDSQFNETFMGDSIVFIKQEKIEKGKVIASTKQNDYFFIKHTLNTEHSNILKIPKNKVYFISKPKLIETNTSLKLNQQIEFQRNGIQLNGKVIGLGFNEALIQTNQNADPITISYNQL